MIHENLKEYLDSGKSTEKDLAQELGVTISHINMIKNGERRPSPELARKIEQLTGIPLRNLLFPKEANTA